MNLSIMQVLLLIAAVWLGLWALGWLFYALARMCISISDFFSNPFRKLPK